MTAKRDLKRRVRERQARTGETYVTARRRVLAARDGREPPAVLVVQLHDVSAEAERFGFRCQIRMFPVLRERTEPVLVLAGLRDALVGAPGDPAAVRLFGAAFGLPSPGGPQPEERSQLGRRRSRQRLRAEIRYTSEPNAMVTFDVAGRDGIVSVLCVLWGTAIVLTVADSRMVVDLSSIVSLRASVSRRSAAELAVLMTGALEAGLPRPTHAVEPGDPVRVIDGPFAGFSASVEQVDADQQWVKVSLSISGHARSVVLDAAHVVKATPVLFVIYEGQRLQIVRQPFLIGRTQLACDLVLRDGHVSRTHAAVLRRHGAYYLKDLGSTHGIHYKGMQIDNKRIEEGDVFHIGEHELQFTYRQDG